MYTDFSGHGHITPFATISAFRAHCEDMAATSRLPPELVDPIITLACIAYVDSLILNTLIVDEEEARRPEGEQVRAP